MECLGKNGQQSKYVKEERTHTPSTLRTIPLGVLNRLTKITPRKPSIHSEGVEKIYPNHANALRNTGPAPNDFPTMGYLWSKQDKRVDIEKEPDVSKEKNSNV